MNYSAVSHLLARLEKLYQSVEFYSEEIALAMFEDDGADARAAVRPVIAYVLDREYRVKDSDGFDRSMQLKRTAGGYVIRSVG